MDVAAQGSMVIMTHGCALCPVPCRFMDVAAQGGQVAVEVALARRLVGSLSHGHGGQPSEGHRGQPSDSGTPLQGGQPIGPSTPLKEPGVDQDDDGDRTTPFLDGWGGVQHTSCLRGVVQ